MASSSSQDIYSKPLKLTKDEEDLILQVEKYLADRQTRGVQVSERIFDNFASGALENPISNKIYEGVYHTPLGRAFVTSLHEFNVRLSSTFSYLFAMRLNDMMNYMLTVIGKSTNNVLLTSVFTFIVLVVHSIWTSMESKGFAERMGTADIIEDTYEDIAYAKKRREGRPLRARDIV